jgi:hypothetical protein
LLTSDSELEKRKRLIQLIRQLAREEAYTVLDEHLSDCEHKEKLPSEVDMQ